MKNTHIKRLVVFVIALVLVLPCMFREAFAATIIDGVDITGHTSITNGVVTFKSRNSGSLTMTITNNSGSKAKISFEWECDADATAFQINDVDRPSAGSDTFVVDAGGTIKIYTKATLFKSVDGTLRNFKIEADGTFNVTMTHDTTKGSVSVNGTAIGASATQSITSVSGATITVTPKAGYEFLGWVKPNTNEIVSTSASFLFRPNTNVTMEARFISIADDTAYFAVGSATKNTYTTGLVVEKLGITTGGWIPKEYVNVQGEYLCTDLATALACATEKGLGYIMPLNSGVVTGDHVIPNGVTLLVPFDNENSLYKENAGYADSYVTPTPYYRTLTLAEGASITVADGGAISVSAKHSRLQSDGHGNAPSGPVGMLYMEKGSTITVNKGGKLFAYGYITCPAGEVIHGVNHPDGLNSGTITIKDGGTVYEHFQVTDFRGGTQSSEMKNHVFSLGQYYVQNVEVPMTLESGATEICVVTICVYDAKCALATSAALIGKDGSMINLVAGNFTKSYDGTTDRQIWVSNNGTVKVEPVVINLGLTGILAGLSGVIGMSDIDSSEYVLPFNNNITFIVKSGAAVTLTQDMAVVPGVEVIIEESASITLGSGVNVYIYDTDDWGTYWYCGAVNNGSNVRIAPIIYAPSRGANVARDPNNIPDAKVLVNGTIDVSQGALYTTTGSANICSTAKGMVIMGKVSDSVTYQFIQAATNAAEASYVNIPVYSAYLKNANGTYVHSQADTYTYNLATGRWECSAHIRADGACICSVCGAHNYDANNDYICSCINNKFYATNVNLGNNLDMLFAFPVTTGASYAVFTREGHDPVVVEIDTTETVKIGTVECYYVSYSGFAAKEMCDTVYVHLYDSSNNRITECKNDGIRKYAMRMLEKLASEDDEASKYLKRVIVDMLDYGTACQTYFGYKTTDMANKDLTDVQRAYTSETLPTVTGTTIANSYWNGSNLITSSNIQLAMAFKNVTGEMYVQFSYKGHKGNSVTSEKLYPQNTADGYITVPELVVADSRCPVTVTVYNADGTVVASWTESIESYVGRNTADDPVFLAFMKFSDSAKVYLHNKNS